jgi:hypothetical protein
MVMARQSKSQKKTVGRVMHEFKHGELRIRGTGPKVRNPKQAIAIALREAGASRRQSPKEGREALRKTKTKERRGETAKSRTESRKGRASSSRGKAGRSASRTARGKTSTKTRTELYAEARRRGIPGRSRMSKQQLERALAR